jgi:hypothetical protein
MLTLPDAAMPITEKQGELARLGGWQKQMARRRYQKGKIRKHGKQNPAWELPWWTDCINRDGKMERRGESVVLGPAAGMTRRQALKAAEENLRSVGNCKTEASRKPVPLDAHVAADLWLWKEASKYSKSGDRYSPVRILRANTRFGRMSCC